MSEITDKFDEFMLHVTDHGNNQTTREKYRHLRRLIEAQEHALSLVIKENTQHAEQLELVCESNRRGSEEIESLRAERDNFRERCAELESRLDLGTGNMYDVVVLENEKLREWKQKAINFYPDLEKME